MQALVQCVQHRLHHELPENGLPQSEETALVYEDAGAEPAQMVERRISFHRLLLVSQDLLAARRTAYPLAAVRRLRAELNGNRLHGQELLEAATSFVGVPQSVRQEHPVPAERLLPIFEADLKNTLPQRAHLAAHPHLERAERGEN